MPVGLINCMLLIHDVCTFIQIYIFILTYLIYIFYYTSCMYIYICIYIYIFFSHYMYLYCSSYLACVVGVKELMDELNQLLDTKTGTLLGYDTTFKLGDFYVSVLVFRHSVFS